MDKWIIRIHERKDEMILVFNCEDEDLPNGALRLNEKEVIEQWQMLLTVLERQEKPKINVIWMSRE